MVHATLNEHGRVDILVNNAGIFPASAVEEMQEEEWDRDRDEPGRSAFSSARKRSCRSCSRSVSDELSA